MRMATNAGRMRETRRTGIDDVDHASFGATDWGWAAPPGPNVIVIVYICLSLPKSTFDVGIGDNKLYVPDIARRVRGMYRPIAIVCGKGIFIEKNM